MFDRDRFRKGDPAHFRELVGDYGTMVLMVIQPFAEGPDEAEDLFQKVWLRVYEKRDSFAGRGPFSAWMRTLALNVCREDARRARRRREALELFARWNDLFDLAFPDPEALVISKEELRYVQDALRQVTPRERDAVKLRYFKGMNSRQAAEIMGIKESSVRALVWRAIDRLRRAGEETNHGMP